MRHEKIIKRKDGTRVSIDITGSVDFMRNDASWRFTIATCAKGKRTWVPVVDTQDYNFRRLSSGEKVQFKINESLKVVSRDEIETAMLECWEKMRPSVKQILKQAEKS